MLGVLSWNGLEYTEIYGAAMKGGFIASPFNARLQDPEIEHLVNYAETHTLFVGADELIGHCKAHLARFKAPKAVEIVEEIPKNPAGKILKRQLRSRYWEGRDRSI